MIYINEISVETRMISGRPQVRHPSAVFPREKANKFEMKDEDLCNNLALHKSIWRGADNAR